MIVEIRTYRLKAGERDEFVRVMLEESVPLLRSSGIRVVSAGGSLGDQDEDAFLIRAFGSLAEHEEQEAAFYRSDPWVTGPREAIVSRIESSHNVLIELSEDQVDALEGIPH
ncbi:NIPSNAP family protein [Microbacterium sp. BWT-B31]|uniref:NIPSNAP family protein n=1 Tax=Microbacterium sp. BWT-B31 TaxID=3232072 RepID=UPI003527FF82